MSAPLPPTPPPGTPAGELRVRFNPVAGVLFLVVGVLLVLLGVVIGEVIEIAAGSFLSVLGIGYAVGTAVVAHHHEVQVKNPLQMTMKRVPVDGLGDLRLDGKVLRRAADDKKIFNLGWGTARSSDIEALRQAIVSARAT